MEAFQVVPLSPSLRKQAAQLLKDFRSAVNYVSFYSLDSPFVSQSLRKLHEEFSAFLKTTSPVLFHRQEKLIAVNGLLFEGTEPLRQLWEKRAFTGLQFHSGLTFAETARMMEYLASPAHRNENFCNALSEKSLFPHIACFEKIEVLFEGKMHDQTPPASLQEEAPPFETAAEPLPKNPLERLEPENIVQLPTDQVLALVAECWQYAIFLRRHENSAPEILLLQQSFRNLFHKLLDRLEEARPDFREIAEWFRAKEGEPVSEKSEQAVSRLLEKAVENNWTGVLADASTVGLVGEALARWGAEGRHDLLSGAVRALANLLPSPSWMERRTALMHLRDPRPFLLEPSCVLLLLHRLTELLAIETIASLYQSALLLSFDLIEPALESNGGEEVLALIETLQSHAEEPHGAFSERHHLARHFLQVKATPDLLRRLVETACAKGKLAHYPLLNAAAAPVFWEDFRRSTVSKQSDFLNLFRQMRDAVQSQIVLALGEAEEERQVQACLPVLRAIGVDAATGLVLASWMAKGSRELQFNIMGTLEQSASKEGAVALRPALFEDSEEIAEEAVRLIGKLGYRAGVPLLLHAADLREKHGKLTASFRKTLCEAFAELQDPAAIPFLEETAKKSGWLGRKTQPLSVRIAAARALVRFSDPAVWKFLEDLSQEKDPEFQAALSDVIAQRAGAPEEN